MRGSARKPLSDADQLFKNAYAHCSGSVQALIRASDLYPVYISSNFQHVLGVAAVRFQEDIETLYRFIPEPELRLLKRQLHQWDKRSTLEVVVSYGMPGAAKAPRKLMRLTLRPAYEGSYYLMLVDDATREMRATRKLKKEADEATKLAQERQALAELAAQEVCTKLAELEQATTEGEGVAELISSLQLFVENAQVAAALEKGHIDPEQLMFELRMAKKPLAEQPGSEDVNDAQDAQGAQSAQETQEE